ncbi:hypothetical protein V6N11_035289 [Hibiscus sabdariffa]|uniref:Uncharacterized protein n=1 Tax=Hibiscus sabdariffa TaxID=183260 RepID=A0ABR2R015_9ROSI
MSSRGIKLVVPPKMHQNLFLELNNGGSARGMPCGQQIILLLCLFYTFVCSAPQNAIAMQLTWVFPHVKRQLAQEFTYKMGQVQPFSFSFVCPLVHQCCSINMLTILPEMLQHLFLLSPCNCIPAHHHQTTPFSCNTNPQQTKRLKTYTHAIMQSKCI